MKKITTIIGILEEWKTAGQKLDALIKSIKTRFLSAAPYSKLK